MLDVFKKVLWPNSAKRHETYCMLAAPQTANIEKNYYGEILFGLIHETYKTEDMIDHHSYAHNISSCEIKARRKIQA